jgi:hypothetical protein
MKFFLLIFITFLLYNCSSAKTVLICGDHVCVNKNEANQYFEENLSIEVKIIDKTDKENFDLVQLNLNNDSSNNRKIKIENKRETNENIKVLSSDEIKNIKKNIQKKNKRKKLVNKPDNLNINNNKILDKKKTIKTVRKSTPMSKVNSNNIKNDVVDICSIIDKCNIDEISKYLLKRGNKDKFPDITVRE